MTTQADASTTDISAETVGNVFVSQFYELLHYRPEFVNRFFNDQSTMKRPGPTGSLVTATAMDGIKDLILSLDCTNYKAEILTADTQASYQDGVTVLVTGFLTGQDNIKRKFSESFFLAPQEGGYFVLNNIFRFIDQESLPVDPVEEPSQKTSPKAPVSLVEKITPAAPVSAVTPAQETAVVSDNSIENHAAVVKEIVEITAVPVEQQKTTSVEKVAPQPSTDSTRGAQPAVDAQSNGDAVAPKKTYASLLMNGKHNSSSLPMNVPAKPVKRNVAPKSVPPPAQKTQSATAPAAAAAPAAASQISAVNGNSSGNGHAGSNGHVSAKGYSIYIGHLPYDATPELVEREFKMFGRIKKNGIQVRSNKGYVFGFVEYEDAAAQEKALETGIIQIGDREVQIEEKRTVSRADDYPSGRGGYRNDGYRRSNYSNGRGYARNDYARRNGEGAAPRGRGNGDGYVSQNGGGRGSRQGGAQK